MEDNQNTQESKPDDDKGKTVHIGGQLQEDVGTVKVFPLCEKLIGKDDYVCGMSDEEGDKAQAAMDENRMCSVCQTIIERAQIGFAQGYEAGQLDAFAAMDSSKKKEETKSRIITLN